MNRIKILFSAIVAMFVVSFANAQTLEETSEELSAQHVELEQKSNELQSGAVEDYGAFVEEMETIFNKSKKNHENLEKKQNGKEKQLYKSTHASMKKNYAAAEKHLNSMKAEAAKPKPNENLIKQQSKLFVSQIKEAEKFNRSMSKNNPKSK